jgi:hypothetical protein
LHPTTQTDWCFPSSAARAGCCKENAAAAIVPLAPTRKERRQVEDESLVTSDDKDDDSSAEAVALSLTDEETERNTTGDDGLKACSAVAKSESGATKTIFMVGNDEKVATVICELSRWSSLIAEEALPARAPSQR